eukprot:13475326-Ditylum_brightwellii.AAC.1
MKANFAAHKLLDYWDLDDDDEADADADADEFFAAIDNFPHYMALAPPNNNPTSFLGYWPNHHFVGNIDTD